jgi:heptosyltransferase-2
MSLKRNILEGLVYLTAQATGGHDWVNQTPHRIFVLRNNDIGDLLVITPAFEALKKAFPQAEIIAGVGSWNIPVLENNPFVDRVLTLNAPWHNKQTTTVRHNSILGLYRSLKYILFSKDVKRLKAIHCDTGIDILGSPEGALLMLRSGIRNRVGVRGYAGGHTACQKNISFDAKRHVSQASLEQVKLLTSKESAAFNIAPKPQIYLSQEEISWAEDTWKHHEAATNKKSLRILIGAGAGLIEKCWPNQSFGALSQKISTLRPSTILSVGAHQDAPATRIIQAHTPSVVNLCGSTTLRQTFALCSSADLILCNSSMLMHAGAAFNKRTAVFLGPGFTSAQEHALTWGYPQTCIIMGPEYPSLQLTSPEEAYQELCQKQWI